MTYENIQITTANLTIDRSGSAFYTVDHVGNKLIKKNSAGTVIFSYFLAEDIEEVQSLQFDGYYYWTLEKFGTSGFRVRKWEIGSDDLVRVKVYYSETSDAINHYDVNAMAVEYYDDLLDNSALAGTNTFDVTDGGTVRIGDRLVVGPSTAVGYVGNYVETVVVGKVGNTLTVSPLLGSSFSPNDVVYFTRSLFIFSDTAPADYPGALYKFDAHTGSLLTLDVSNMYNLVRATTFFKNYLMFVRAGEVIWVNPDTQELYRSQAIDNLNENRTEYNTAYDLAGYSDTIYRLETCKVYYSEAYSRYETEDWSPQYNYNTSTTVPAVYFVAIKADPPSIHRAVQGLIPESIITVEVLDQFRTPVQSRTVAFSSTGGALTSIQETTDSAGKASTTYTATTDSAGKASTKYTANTTIGEITVTAEVT